MHLENDAQSRYWLTLGMAKAIGVNLTESLHSGQITRAQFTEIVSRCLQCETCDICTEWLAQQIAIAEKVPKTCANHAVFAALKAGQNLADWQSLPE